MSGSRCAVRSVRARVIEFVFFEQKVLSLSSLNNRLVTSIEFVFLNKRLVTSIEFVL